MAFSQPVVKSWKNLPQTPDLTKQDQQYKKNPNSLINLFEPDTFYIPKWVNEAVCAQKHNQLEQDVQTKLFSPKEVNKLTSSQKRAQKEASQHVRERIFTIKQLTQLARLDKEQAYKLLRNRQYSPTEIEENKREGSPYQIESELTVLKAFVMTLFLLVLFMLGLKRISAVKRDNSRILESIDFSENNLTDEARNNYNKYTCIITQAIMSEPVVALHSTSLQNFEKKALLQWLSKNPTHPLTREPLDEAELSENGTLQQEINTFVDELVEAEYRYDWPKF